MGKRLKEEIYHDGKLILFQRDDGKGKAMPYWYYTIKIPKQKTIKDKSTKETKRSSALLIAETQYKKVQQKLNLGLPIHTIRFQQVVNEASRYYENRVYSGELAKERFNRFKRTMKDIVIPFVNEKDKDFTELNRLYPEILKKGVNNCSLFLPFEKISEYYRQTDIFLPTHKESQGMLAQEIGACGGITVLQEWMYPKITTNQFISVFYQENQKIDFLFLKKFLEKHPKEQIRNYVL